MMYVVLVALAPDRLRLRLHSLVASPADCAVQHAQRALDLDGEVDVAGRVDDVETLALPEAGRRRRGDGDAALLLLLHEVHGRGAVVHLADLVGLAGVEEDPLGRGRLAGIDVGHDAEIAVVLDPVGARHCPAVRSPTVVGEGPIGLCHLVRVFPFLHRSAAVVGGVEEFARQALLHCVLVAAARGCDEPADRQRLPALVAHLDRNLVGGTADAARAHLHRGHDVLQRLMEELDRVRLGLGLHLVQRAVDDALGNRLLALLHDRVHEFGHDEVVVLRVRVDLASLSPVPARHVRLPS